MDWPIKQKSPLLRGWRCWMFPPVFLGVRNGYQSVAIFCGPFRVLWSKECTHMANITDRCSSEEVIRQKLRLEEAQAGLSNLSITPTQTKNFLFFIFMQNEHHRKDISSDINAMSLDTLITSRKVLARKTVASPFQGHRPRAAHKRKRTDFSNVDWPKPVNHVFFYFLDFEKPKRSGSSTRVRMQECK